MSHVASAGNVDFASMHIEVARLIVAGGRLADNEGLGPPISLTAGLQAFH